MKPRLQLLDSLDRVDAAAWDALHDGDNPFVSHAFLSGLETTGCLRPRWGWTPCHAALFEGETLVGAAPGYRKDNSHGEFVFDHAWAAAYARFGRDYFPKWLLAVPYSPVPGPRLLARDDRARAGLTSAIADSCESAGFSSAHVNFMTATETPSCDARWLARSDLQFHWINRGWNDFDDFLAAMSHKRRKAIRQEREKVRRAGFRFRVVHGDEAVPADLEAMHGFYCATFAEKGNSPALTLDFFRHLSRTMPRALVLILAEQHGRTVAGALCLRGGPSRHPASRDTGTSLCGGDTLYGRYWGCDEAAPGLHFETCYYQGIDYCLREGLSRFEPGAQGEHKLARGFLPVTTHSRHFIVDPEFAQALAPWCAQERAEIWRYRNLLLAHSPFREAES